MQPRILFYTHYQIDEPSYMKFIVKLCTSPVQSSYPEVVAEKLAREIRLRAGKLNPAAAGYAVELGKDLEIITANQTWTEKGFLVDLIARVGDEALDSQLRLNLAEKLLHFHIFLEGDGAAFLFLARRFCDHRSVTNSDDTWNTWAKEMFTEVYAEYLAITNNTVDRVELRRKIDRIKSEGYKGNSGSHKLFIHLQTLHRLGLLYRPDKGGSRVYQVPEQSGDHIPGLEIFAREIPDVVLLEKVIASHQWLQVATKVFGLVAPSGGTSVPMDGTGFLHTLVTYYKRVMATGAPLCPISTVIEATRIFFLVEQSRVVDYDDLLNLLVATQKRQPREVRFHVDRMGRPAFLKLSGDFTEAYAT
jgi:hypothetical protein